MKGRLAFVFFSKRIIGALADAGRGLGRPERSERL